MPHSDLHKKKLKKNLAVLGIILGSIAVIWVITMIKISGASWVFLRYPETMKRFKLFTIFTSLMISASALAGEVVNCGTPNPANLSTEVTDNYCDIYQRQLEYGVVNEQFREQIAQRRENYHAPRREAKTAYDEALKALHESKGRYAKDSAE